MSWRLWEDFVLEVLLKFCMAFPRMDGPGLHGIISSHRYRLVDEKARREMFNKYWNGWSEILDELAVSFDGTPTQKGIF